MNTALVESCTIVPPCHDHPTRNGDAYRGLCVEMSGGMGMVRDVYQAKLLRPGSDLADLGSPLFPSGHEGDKPSGDATSENI